MNSQTSSQPAGNPPSADDHSGGSAIGVALWGVLLLAALLVGVYFWDTWTDRRTDRQAVDEVGTPASGRDEAPNGKPSRPVGADRSAVITTNDVEQLAGSQPSAAEDDAAGPESATPPPSVPGQNGASSTGSETARPENGATQDLATIDPFEVEGVQWGGNGRSVSISGTRYEHPICIEPSSAEKTAQISFSLKGKWARLRGVVGVSDGEGDSRSTESDRSAATFRIYGDANLLWESKTLTGGGAVEVFEVDVAQLDILALVVESRSTSSDERPVWGNLQLVARPDSDSSTDGETSEP